MGERVLERRIAELHAEHGPAILQFLTRLTGGADQAEDLFQETMLRAWRRLGSVPQESEAARRWFHAVARHVTVDAVRARRRRPAEVSLCELATPPAGEDAVDEVIAEVGIGRAFGRLTDRQREVLRELHFEGRPLGEVARRLAVPTGTVRSRAYYAMRALHANLD